MQDSGIQTTAGPAPASAPASAATPAADHGAQNLRGMGLALAGFSLFALGDAIVKHLSGFYNIWTIQFYSLLFTCLTLFILARPLGGLRATFRSIHLKWHLLRGVIVFIQALTITYAFAQMSLAKTYSIVFSMPFFATLLAMVFMKESADLRKWLAMGLGFAGVLVVLRPGLIPLESPALVALGSAVAFACSNLMARRFGRRDEPMLTLALLPALSGIACALPLFLLNMDPGATPLGVPDLPHLGWFLVLGSLVTGAFLCLSLSFTLVPAALAAPFHYSQMIWGVTLGWFLFGDRLDLWTGIGAAIIIASGLWLIQQGRAPMKTPPPHG